MDFDGFLEPPRSEPSFFFRLSKYQQKVIQHIEDRPRYGMAVQCLEKPSINMYEIYRCQNCHLDFGCIERLTVSRPMRILFSQLSGCLSTCDGVQQKVAQESPHFLCCADRILLI